MLTSLSKLPAASAQPAPVVPAGCTERPCAAKCSLRETCRRLWLARRTRTELSALSEPELNDIGLFRGDIERVAAENYR